MVNSWFVLLILLAMATTAAAAGGAEDTRHGFTPHHHAAMFLGAGVERKRDGREKEVGIAIGGEYEYRFQERWGVGGVIEGLGKDTIRDIVVVAPVSFHPATHWRLFAGPGYEFTEKKDKALLRVGVGYEFHLRNHWTLAPELIADFISGGAQTWLGGIAVGYEF